MLQELSRMLPQQQDIIGRFSSETNIDEMKNVLKDAVESVSGEENKKLVKTVADIANNLFELGRKTTLPVPPISYYEALWQADCLVRYKDGERAVYESKKEAESPYSFAVSGNKAAVFFKRDQSKIGDGCEKNVYSSLVVNLSDASVEEGTLHTPLEKGFAFFASTCHVEGLLQGSRGIVPYTFFFGHVSNKHQKATQKIVQPYGGRSFESLTEGCQSGFTLVDQVKASLDVAYGLEALHEKGIVHEDVRLSNLLYNGKKGFLIDFGLSHKVDEEPACERNKWFYSVYTSPEHVDAIYMKHGPGYPGDMYALGCALYEALLREEPSWCKDLNEMWMRYSLSTINGEPEDVEKKKSLLRFPESRAAIRQKQSVVLDRLRDFEGGKRLSKEQKYLYVIYQLLHPDPEQRLTVTTLKESLEAILADL